MLAFDLWPCWKGVAVDVEGWRMGCFFFFRLGRSVLFMVVKCLVLRSVGLLWFFLVLGR